MRERRPDLLGHMALSSPHGFARLWDLQQVSISSLQSHFSNAIRFLQHNLPDFVHRSAQHVNAAADKRLLGSRAHGDMVIIHVYEWTTAGVIITAGISQRPPAADAALKLFHTNCASYPQFTFLPTTFITHDDGSHWVGCLPQFVRVSVYPHDISKTDAARITKLDIEMFHDESWKPIYFGAKG